MGLRCSVLGHRYGERERVEERDERGDEVITAVREVKTCERCGDELVVTESKEVTAVDAPTFDEPEPSEPDEPEAAPVDPEPEPIDPDPPTPAEDDGIILPDEPAEERSEWPADHLADDGDGTASDERTGDGNGEPAAWPELDAEDEGFDAAAADMDDEVADRIIEAVRSQPADPEGENTEAGFFRVTPMDDPADPSDTDPHAEYYCPSCDWSAESLVTSVRRGDICPACRRGYVAERDPD